MKLFVFGLGYTAIRFVELYGNRFETVAGTVRTDAKKADLRRQGFDAFRFD
ncbi:MAG: NAD(P)-dependent oxidoreductase, partial [Hyphomicrobiales bacterium]